MFAHLQVHMQMENHYSSAHKGATYKEVHIYGIFQQRSNRSSDPSLSHWVPASASGERSTCWKATATTTPVPSPQGMKQLMAGGGVALIGTTLVPLLSGLFG